METFAKKIPVILLLVLGACTMLIWYAVFYFESNQGLRMIFFDVGQGDGILVQHNGATQVLIDGGPNDAVLGKLGKTMPFWDRSLDAIILTHPEKDHLSGLIDVLKRYHVDAVLWTGVRHSTAEYREWEKLLEEKNIPVEIIFAGKRLVLGERVVLDFLAPFENLDGQSVKDMNDTSIVGKLQYGDTSALLMGDASKAVERRLMFESPAALDADVLKVGHHGSKTSTREEFLKIVTPEMAIISAGRKNRYGHPHQEVLDRLKLFGVAILRTDEDRDIMVASDGRYVTIAED